MPEPDTNFDPTTESGVPAAAPAISPSQAQAGLFGGGGFSTAEGGGHFTGLAGQGQGSSPSQSAPGYGGTAPDAGFDLGVDMATTGPTGPTGDAGGGEAGSGMRRGGRVPSRTKYGRDPARVWKGARRLAAGGAVLSVPGPSSYGTAPWAESEQAARARRVRQFENRFGAVHV